MRETGFRKLITVAAPLGAAYLLVMPEFEVRYPGWWMRCTHGYRSQAAQLLAFQQGNSNADGQEEFSDHQVFPSQALDWLIFKPDGTVLHDGEDPKYRWVGESFEECGIAWGGRWPGRPDWDHAYIRKPGNVTLEEVTASAAKWANLADLRPDLV